MTSSWFFLSTLRNISFSYKMWGYCLLAQSLTRYLCMALGRAAPGKPVCHHDVASANSFALKHHREDRTSEFDTENRKIPIACTEPKNYRARHISWGSEPKTTVQTVIRKRLGLPAYIIQLTPWNENFLYSENSRIHRLNGALHSRESEVQVHTDNEWRGFFEH